LRLRKEGAGSALAWLSAAIERRANHDRVVGLGGLGRFGGLGRLLFDLKRRPKLFNLGQRATGRR
jgi:hypothetical protein